MWRISSAKTIINEAKTKSQYKVMTKQLHVYLEDTGNIIIDFNSSAIRDVLKACLPFTKSSTTVRYSRYIVDEEGHFATIWMPKTLHIDKCEIFYRALVRVLELYFILSNDNVEVIKE